MLSLEAHIEVLEIQKKKEGKVNVNYITVKSSKNKVRCPICNQFTSTIHDYLKPSKIQLSETTHLLTCLKKESSSVIRKGTNETESTQA